MIVRRVSSVAFLPVNFMLLSSACRFAGISSIALLLANCASEPTRSRTLSAQNQREVGAFADKRKYGTASPRVVADGQSVPKGGGRDHTGKPYQVAGRWYTPRENPNYSSTGMSSWYGDAFHGRKTANGEIYDKHSYTAAHPTMPLPSYARVTNATNGRSIIVRVNDRGPFHGGRIIDVSERVANALEFKHLGTARVRVDYVSRASTSGSEDRKLFASLRTDGQLAQLEGGSTPIPSQQPILVASNTSVPLNSQPSANIQNNDRALGFSQVAAPVASRSAIPAPMVAAQPNRSEIQQETNDETQLSEIKPVRRSVPLPPDRPFDLGSIPGADAPLGRVNNGQITPQRATTLTAQPARERVAAVYYAPVEGFKAVFAGNDPMKQLKPGAFSQGKHQAVGPIQSAEKLNAGLFREKGNAERLSIVLSRYGKPDIETVKINGSTLYRVTALQFSSPEKAAAALVAAKAAGAKDAQLTQ
jgi:rare lipoprotein A